MSNTQLLLWKAGPFMLALHRTRNRLAMFFSTREQSYQKKKSDGFCVFHKCIDSTTYTTRTTANGNMHDATRTLPCACLLGCRSTLRSPERNNAEGHELHEKLLQPVPIANLVVTTQQHSLCPFHGGDLLARTSTGRGS